VDHYRYHGGREEKFSLQEFEALGNFLRCRSCAGIFYINFSLFHVVVGILSLNVCRNLFSNSILYIKLVFDLRPHPHLFPGYLMVLPLRLG
jgi:hypothetical protein